MTARPPHLAQVERDGFGRVTRSVLNRWECGNCGRYHIGFYTTWYLFEGGREVDFIWTDWQGNERLCDAGHRRDPCTPECLSCWLKTRTRGAP